MAEALLPNFRRHGAVEELAGRALCCQALTMCEDAAHARFPLHLAQHLRFSVGQRRGQGQRFIKLRLLGLLKERVQQVAAQKRRGHSAPRQQARAGAIPTPPLVLFDIPH